MGPMNMEKIDRLLNSMTLDQKLGQMCMAGICGGESVDFARRNVAELGLGCNDKAVVQGAIIEDEKAGFHWAYGRSEHLGGTVGPGHFTHPANVIHQDIVYAPASPIGIRELTLRNPDQSVVPVIRRNKYVPF